MSKPNQRKKSPPKRAPQKKSNLTDIEAHRYKQREERTTRAVFGITIFAFTVLCLGVIHNLLTHTPVPTTSVAMQTGVREGFHTGFVVREEQAYVLDFFGRVSFVTPTYSRVRAGDLVATIEDVFVNEPAQEQNQLLQAQILSLQDFRAPVSIHAEDAQYINDNLREIATEYAYRLSDNPDFAFRLYDVADGHVQMRNSLLLSETLGSVAGYVRTFDENTQFIASNQQTIRSNSGGIVAHGVDGFEHWTADNILDLTPNDLHGPTHLPPIDNGVFRVVTSNMWHVAGFFEPYEVAHLYRGQSTRLYLVEEDPVLGYTFRSVLANVSHLEQRGTQVLAVFSMRDFMMDYINQRLIQFRLEDGELSGMAIPNDAIASRTLLVIPAQFVETDEDDNNSVTILNFDDEGMQILSLNRVSPVISRNNFDITDEVLVVQDFNQMSLGTILVNDAGEHYTLNRVVTDAGVFRVNNGVATFVSINPTNQLVLENYTLLSLLENRGGLVVHDRIVSNTRDYLIYAGRIIQ